MPCAGQTNANWEPFCCLKEPSVSELVENFGLAKPTSSKQDNLFSFNLPE
jgi:hypothetical protein